LTLKVDDFGPHYNMGGIFMDRDDENEDDLYGLFEFSEYEEYEDDEETDEDFIAYQEEVFDFGLHIENLMHFMIQDLGVSMDFARYLVNQLLPDNYEQMIFEVQALYNEIQKKLDNGSLVTGINEDGEITYGGKPK